MSDLLQVDDFRCVKVLEGGEVELPSLLERAGDLAGFVFIFWSAVCSHCRRYDETLSRFEERYPSLALFVIGCRQGERLEDLRAAAGQRGLAFPLYLDPERALSQAWHVQQTPTAFLLSTELKPVYRGAIDNFTYRHSADHTPYLENAIEDWLQDRPVRLATTATFGCPTASIYYQMSSRYGLPVLTGHAPSGDPEMGAEDSAEDLDRTDAPREKPGNDMRSKP